MFEQQLGFMRLLQEKRTFPSFPVDLKSKVGQRECKLVVYEVMGELFESIQELKNAKSHRATDLSGDFDRAKLVEELVDALHYYVELCGLVGVTSDELYTAYVAKGEKNVDRINGGY